MKLRSSRSILGLLFLAVIGLSGCNLNKLEHTETRISASDHTRLGETDLQLGATSHFGQGWSLSVLDQSRELEISLLRDALNWAIIEKEKGVYDFSATISSFPYEIEKSGKDLTLTFAGANPLYDNGKTPYSDEAIEAWVKYIDAALQQFPFVKIIEISNEFNGNQFVSGPILELDFSERSAQHLRHTNAVLEMLELNHPDVKLVGGAAHSLPVGFLSDVLNHPNYQPFDGVVIHPYGTTPEQLRGQIQELRKILPDAELPIHITEIGVEDLENSADFFLKYMSWSKALGIKNLVWYALYRQSNYANIPLIETGGELSEVGEAFVFAQQHFIPFEFENISPDPFTTVFKVGRNKLIVWGERRSINFLKNKDITVKTASGSPMDSKPLYISPDEVYVIESNHIELGRHVTLGPQSIVADSFLQFDYDPYDAEDKSPFQYVFRSPIEDISLETMPGGRLQNGTWRPHLANRGFNPMMVSAEYLVPAVFDVQNSNDKSYVDVVVKYVASEDYVASANLYLEPKGYVDGKIAISVSQNGDEILSTQVDRESHLTVNDLVLRKGDLLEFVYGVDRGSLPRLTHYRVQIQKEPN